MAHASWQFHRRSTIFPMPGVGGLPHFPLDAVDRTPEAPFSAAGHRIPLGQVALVVGDLGHARQPGGV